MIQLKPNGLSRPNDSKKLTDVKLSIEVHNTETNELLVFRSTGYEKKSFMPLDPFVVFNQCAEDFPKEKNDKLWALYKTIHKFMELDNSNERLAEAVAICRELIDTVNYFDIKHTIAVRRLVLPSPDQPEHYTESLGIRERTYVQSDLVDLIALAVLLKCMVPVWGQYIGGKSIDSTDVVRYAFALCGDAIKNLDPTVKLRTYVDSNFAANRDPIAIHTFTGVSTYNLPEVTFATIIIRKIAIDPLLNDGIYSKKLISGVWSVIGSNTRNPHGGNPYRGKESTKSSGAEEEASILERVRPVSPQPEGVIAAIRHLHKDMATIFAREFPEVDNDKIKLAIMHNQGVHWATTPGQLLIATWICDAFMPHAVVPHLTLEHAKAMQAAGYVVLKHYNHDHIADLLIAKIVKNTSNAFSLSSGRPNPPPERMAAFDSKYRVHLAPTKMGEIRNPAQPFIEQVLTDITDNRVFRYDPLTDEEGGIIVPDMDVRTRLLAFCEFCLDRE